MLQFCQCHTREIYSDFRCDSTAISIARKIRTCELLAILLRHRDIADDLNMFKFHRDIGATFFAKKIALKIAVYIARVNGPL